MTTGAPKPADRWDTDKNIRARLANWMRDHGYFEPREAGTNAPADNELVVESVYGARRHIRICGVPEGGNQDQARVVVARAVLDLSVYRNEAADVSLALALPVAFATYTALAVQLAWLRHTMPFTIYWVSESGGVRVE